MGGMVGEKVKNVPEARGVVLDVHAQVWVEAVEVLVGQVICPAIEVAFNMTEGWCTSPEV